ncbi:carboxypeptidase Q [alpha proteobacterium Q-1]|nr:carboxypeptidase Q [alpha proteobacterium Q-1]
MRFAMRAKALMTAAFLAVGVDSSEGAWAQDYVVAETPATLIKQVETLRTAGLHDRMGYEIIESLTTEIGPRLAGSAREAAAQDWAVAKLKALGFSNIQVEPFEMEGWARGIETAHVVGAAAQPLTITTLGGSVATPDGGITAEVARFDDLYQLEAAPDGSLDGKIVFIDLKMYKTQDGSSYGNTNYIRGNTPSVAARKGAVATLIRSVGTDSHRFPHTGGTRYADDVPAIPAAALSNPDADQLSRLLERGPVSIKLEMTPKSLGTVTSGNVIADIMGSEKPEEVVVIGGHLDSWDLGTGAIDDGAGIGITMAAAKRILDLGIAPRRTIRLILWGAEEVGLLGARAYAKAHADELANHVIAAESDFGAGRIWRFESRVGAEDLPFIRAIHRQLRPLGIGMGANEAGGGPDVIPLRQAGVPVVSLTQDGSDYFDLHHTADDTFDKIELDNIQQNIAAYAVFTWMAANLDVDFRPDAEQP